MRPLALFIFLTFCHLHLDIGQVGRSMIGKYGQGIEWLAHHGLVGPHRQIFKGFGRLLQRESWEDPSDAIAIEAGFVGEHSTGTVCITYSRGLGVVPGEGKAQALQFSKKLGGARVFYMNAISKGLMTDISTCLCEWFGFHNQAVEQMAAEIRRLYHEHRERYGGVVFHRVVYSKSAVDAWAYDQLLEDEIKESIHTYSIAGFKMLRRTGYRMSMNYVNESDIIPILGGFEFPQEGSIYDRCGFVGSLQSHYWESPGCLAIQQRIIQRIKGEL